MKKKQKSPVIPSDRRETIRQAIISSLKEKPHTAKELSGIVRVPEKEIYDHLDHIQKTLQTGDSPLNIIPAECRKCGFVFEKRERLKRPGRCPVCKGESIEDPLFEIR